jgi:hypothetical protein
MAGSVRSRNGADPAWSVCLAAALTPRGDVAARDQG